MSKLFLSFLCVCITICLMTPLQAMSQGGPMQLTPEQAAQLQQQLLILQQQMEQAMQAQGQAAPPNQYAPPVPPPGMPNMSGLPDMGTMPGGMTLEDVDRMLQQHLEQTNQQRARQGLPPLTGDPTKDQNMLFQEQSQAYQQQMQQIYQMANEARAAKGLPPLTGDPVRDQAMVNQEMTQLQNECLQGNQQACQELEAIAKNMEGQARYLDLKQQQQEDMARHDKFMEANEEWQRESEAQRYEESRTQDYLEQGEDAKAMEAAEEARRHEEEKERLAKERDENSGW